VRGQLGNADRLDSAARKLGQGLANGHVETQEFLIDTDAKGRGRGHRLRHAGQVEDAVFGHLHFVGHDPHEAEGVVIQHLPRPSHQHHGSGEQPSVEFPLHGRRDRIAAGCQLGNRLHEHLLRIGGVEADIGHQPARLVPAFGNDGGVGHIAIDLVRVAGDPQTAGTQRASHQRHIARHHLAGKPHQGQVAAELPERQGMSMMRGQFLFLFQGGQHAFGVVGQRARHLHQLLARRHRLQRHVHFAERHAQRAADGSEKPVGDPFDLSRQALALTSGVFLGVGPAARLAIGVCAAALHEHGLHARMGRFDRFLRKAGVVPRKLEVLRPEGHRMARATENQRTRLPFGRADAEHRHRVVDRLVGVRAHATIAAVVVVKAAIAHEAVLARAPGEFCWLQVGQCRSGHVGELIEEPGRVRERGLSVFLGHRVAKQIRGADDRTGMRVGEIHQELPSLEARALGQPSEQGIGLRRANRA